MQSVIDSCRNEIAAAAGVDPSFVSVIVSQGSVKVDADVTIPDGQPVDASASAVAASTDLGSNIVTTLASVPLINTVTTGSLEVAGITTVLPSGDTQTATSTTSTIGSTIGTSDSSTTSMASEPEPETTPADLQATPDEPAFGVVSGMNEVQVASIGVGVIVLVCVACCLFFFCCVRRLRRDKEAQEEGGMKVHDEGLNVAENKDPQAQPQAVGPYAQGPYVPDVEHGAHGMMAMHSNPTGIHPGWLWAQHPPPFAQPPPYMQQMPPQYDQQHPQMMMQQSPMVQLQPQQTQQPQTPGREDPPPVSHAPMDAPGPYKIVVDYTAVGPTVELGEVTAELDAGELVEVLEVIDNKEQHRIRGRINLPHPGWISLCSTTPGDNRRWAEPQKAGGHHHAHHSPAHHPPAQPPPAQQQPPPQLQQANGPPSPYSMASAATPMGAMTPVTESGSSALAMPGGFQIGDPVVSLVDFEGNGGSIRQGEMGTVKGPAKGVSSTKAAVRVNCAFPQHPNINLKVTQIRKVTQDHL